MQGEGSFTQFRLTLALILLFAIIIIFYNLGAKSLHDEDETNYANCIKEHLVRGGRFTV